jgi:tRNA A-37 threonylcarbamoyl transferase component Bud32
MLGRYELLEQVGSGGMAVVYRGRDTALDREVAVKLLHPHLASAKESRARFSREARAVARLAHPGIVEIYDYAGDAAVESYLVTEFVRGRTLRAWAHDVGFGFPEVGMLVGRALADALVHAHSAGVIHRDLKPENVLVRDGDAPAVKLADFGIARILASDERMTMTGALVGSPHHMAPEIVEGKDADARSDLFSLGTILYWLATGKLPFAAPNPTAILRRVLEGDFEDPRAVDARVPDPLAELVASCLSVDPARRPESAAAIRDALDRVLAQVGIDHPDDALQEFLRDPAAFRAAFPARATATLIALGDGALAEGAAARALSFYDRVLALDPENAAVREKLARISRRRRWRRGAVVAAAALGVSGAVAGAAWLAIAARPRPEAEPSRAPTAAAPAADRTEVAAAGSPSPPPAGGAADPVAPAAAAPDAPTPAPVAHASTAATHPAAPPPRPSATQAATLAIHVRPYAQRALLDGVEVARGEQVVRFSLAPGKPHLVQIEHACCAPFVRQITAEEAARIGELRVPLEPRPARLRVDGDATTRVFVEGQLLGTAGDSQRIALPVPIPGGGATPYEAPATIALELASGTRREVKVTLRAGAETIVPGPGAETIVTPFGSDATAPDLDPNAPPPVPGVEEIR